MNLTNEEIIALREFIKWHYIPADNAVLTKLVRCIMNYSPKEIAVCNVCSSRNLIQTNDGIFHCPYGHSNGTAKLIYE